MKVFLDDIRHPSYVYGSGADAEWVTVSTVEEVKRLLKEGNVSHLSLDNDLGYGEPEGYTAVRWMVENNIWPTEEVYVHTANFSRKIEMEADINRYYYNGVKLNKE